MTETTTDERLRDLEAEAFRTGRTLAQHSEDLKKIADRQDTASDQQRTAFANIDSLADAIGAPGDRSITQRLDSIEDQLGDVTRMLRVLTKAQGIDPDA
ncbi:hypothetical protein ACOKM5_43470 [Streptomyces sp. BH097]|uniref:hypothetical protein n=1 Tax=unclassified Streptomyces TaxID=2593676 RepID=UPI003BB4BBC9